MAKVGNIVIYRPKEGRENDLLELVKKHWPAARKAGLTTDDPARVWRATDKRTGRVSILERFFWADADSSSRAHHTPAVQAVWGPMDAVLEDMTILVIEEVAGHPPAKKTRAKTAAAPKRAKSAAKPKPAKKKAAAPKSRAKPRRKAKPAKPLAKRRAISAAGARSAPPGRRAPSARGRGRRATRTTRKGTRRR